MSPINTTNSSKSFGRNLLPWLNRWEELVAGLALGVVFSAVVWGVIARYILPQPAAWSNELATIGFAWVVFIGAAAAAKRRLHIGVDILTSKLPTKTSEVVSLIVNCVLLISMSYVTWLAIDIGLGSSSRPTPVLRLPYTVVYASAVLGLTSISIGLLFDVLRLIRALGVRHD